MHRHARDLSRAPITQEVGVLEAIDARGLSVRTDDGSFTARRAASCLLQPEVGDVVLLAVVPSRDCYVLAVLEREPGAAARLRFDGDVDLHVPAGRLSVASQEGVALVTAGELALVGQQVSAQAEVGSVAVGALSVMADDARAELTRARVEAGSIDTVADRVTERVQRSYRTAEEFDHLRAGTIDHAARETLKLRSHDAVVTAEGLVKVDGAQIHLG